MKGELANLLSLTKDLYKEESPVDRALSDPGKLFELARLNKVLFYLLDRRDLNRGFWQDYAAQADEYFRLGREYFSRLESTVEELQNILGLDTLLFFKTFYRYPRITSDLDILVRSLGAVGTSLTAAGWMQGKFQHGNIHFTKNDRLKVGVHDAIAWGTTEFVDREMVWQRPRKEPLGDRTILIPNYEVDLISILAHIPFEKLHFDLGELLYVYHIAAMADWELIERQAKKHRWHNTLIYLVAVVNGLYRCIYGRASPIEAELPAVRRVELQLPYELPLWPAVRAHMEKGAWTKLASALCGLRIRYVFSGRRERKVRS